MTTSPDFLVVGRDTHLEFLEHCTLQEVGRLALPRRLATTSTFDGKIIVEDMGAHLLWADPSGLRPWRAGSWMGFADGLAWIVDADRGLLASTSSDGSVAEGCIPEITPLRRPRAVIPTAGTFTIVIGHSTVWAVDRRSSTARVLWTPRRRSSPRH